jgi:hypothetical protein
MPDALGHNNIDEGLEADEGAGLDDFLRSLPEMISITGCSDFGDFEDLPSGPSWGLDDLAWLERLCQEARPDKDGQ